MIRLLLFAFACACACAAFGVNETVIDEHFAVNVETDIDNQKTVANNESDIEKHHVVDNRSVINEHRELNINKTDHDKRPIFNINESATNGNNTVVKKDPDLKVNGYPVFDSRLLNETVVDKHLLKRIAAAINTNETIDINKLKRFANKTDLLNKELATLLHSYVNDYDNKTETTQQSRIDDTESYDVYSKNSGPMLVESIEESPDYASSIVLASDVLSLTSAVANVEDVNCKEQGYKFLDGLLLNKRWALQMFDASAKSPEGLLYGSSYHLGNFDECVGVRNEDHDGSTVEGQYCLATIKWHQTDEVRKSRTGRGEVLRWALCVPSACDALTVEGFVTDVLSRSVGNRTSVQVLERDCYYRKPMTVTSPDVVYLSVMLFFIAILILSSCYEVFSIAYRKKNKTRIHELIISFSIWNNTKKILSTKQNDYLGLNCISGIKSVSMILILAGHTCLFVGTGPVMDASSWDKTLKNPNIALVLNSMLLVDTFLMLSAFLFSRLLLVELEKRRGKLNVIPIIIFRYIRLTPSYLVVIFFYITWFPKIGEGPLWKDKIILEQERCKESWWINILYLNNYLDPDKMCMFQSWYLSVDTQLFVIAPIFIFALWRWRRAGPILLSLATLASIIVTAVITYRDNLDPTMMIYAKEFTDIISNYYFATAYIKTHMKMTTYFIGLLMGYLLYRVQTENYELPRALKIVGWTVDVALATMIVFIVSIFYQDWWSYNATEAAAYASLHRLGWGLCNGWLIIACATGNGGVLNRFLSWKLFVPIARLTFSAYLVNGIVELYFIGQLRHPLHVTTYSLVEYGVAHVMLTFVLGMVLCVAFESPIHGIEKVLLSIFVNSKRKDGEMNNQSGESSRTTSQAKLESS